MPYVTPESPVTPVRTSPPSTKLYRALASRNIPSLEGLCAVSVILVVSFACTLLTFFVVSGFLITWLLLKESEREVEACCSFLLLAWSWVQDLPAFPILSWKNPSCV